MEEQKLIIKKWQGDEILMRYSYRVAERLAMLLVKTKITANQITIANFVIFAPIIIFLLIQGKYWFNIIALGAIIVSCTIDNCDGVVARLKGLQSNFGAWLDASLDKVFQMGVFMAICIGVVYATKQDVWFIVGLLLLFGQAMADYMGNLYEKKLNFDPYYGSADFTEKLKNERHINLLDHFLGNVIVPVNLIYQFLFTARYVLTLTILLGRLDIFMIFFTVMINIRWITMYLLYLAHLSNCKTKLKTLEFINSVKPN